MYTITLNQEETARYRSGFYWRNAYQRGADQQMATRLEAAQVIGSDGAVLYVNRDYKGALDKIAEFEPQVDDDERRIYG